MLRPHFATRRPPAARLLVFARVPEPGQVKTRLARDVGDDRALSIYEAMLADVLESIGASDDQMEVEILWTCSGPVTGSVLRRFFGERQLALQTGGGLGDRLAVAFSERFFFHATSKVIAIGTDDPTLSRADILNAFDLLDSCEWVVGPAVDGGYYLIGCRAPSFHSDVFRDMPWGTEEVFRRTCEEIRRIGATLAILPLRRDIDAKADLDELAGRDQPLAGRLGEILRTEAAE